MRAFLGLEVWRWVVGNVFLFKMSFGWNFSDNPCESYALVNLQLTFFSCPNKETFCILMISEPNFENHDQALIKWCLWLQKDMLTKNLNFWLSNDHFAPIVDYWANRLFDCATWCCELCHLTCRCLRICVGLWDLIGPLKTLNSLKELKP